MSKDTTISPQEAADRLEAALRQRGLPFSAAVEAEGYDLQLSLISEGVGFGMVMPQVFYSSALRKHLKLSRRRTSLRS
jgi:hypothetical protein